MRKWNDLVDRWLNFRPPCRPDLRDLQQVDAALRDVSGHKDSKVLILGSTPEFRDICAEYDVLVSVVDQNPRMIERMASAQHSPNPRESKYVEDWFDFLPQHEGVYGLVLSDLTQGNIPYNRRAAFYDGLASSLAPGGLFLDRIFKYDPTSRLYSLQEIVTLHEGHDSSDLNNLNRLLFRLLASEPVRISGTADLGNLYEQVSSIGETSVAHQVEVLARRIAPGSVKWFYGRDWDNLRDDYRSFKLLEEKRRTSEYHRGVPSFQLWQKDS